MSQISPFVTPDESEHNEIFIYSQRSDTSGISICRTDGVSATFQWCHDRIVQYLLQILS